MKKKINKPNQPTNQRKNKPRNPDPKQMKNNIGFTKEQGDQHQY